METGQILISQRTFAAVDDTVRAEERPAISRKGFGRPQPVWAIEGLRE